jgi:hypothetical protein
LDMRAKIAPGGRLTRETERLVKAPGFFSTRSRRARSGWTHAGIWEVEDVPLPFEAGVTVAGDMLASSWINRTIVTDGNCY